MNAALKSIQWKLRRLNDLVAGMGPYNPRTILRVDRINKTIRKGVYACYRLRAKGAA